MKIRWTMQCKSARLERDKRYSGQKSWVTSIVGESDKSTDLDAAKTAMQAESPADRCLRHKQRPYKKRIKLQNKKKRKMKKSWREEKCLKIAAEIRDEIRIIGPNTILEEFSKTLRLLHRESKTRKWRRRTKRLRDQKRQNVTNHHIEKRKIQIWKQTTIAILNSSHSIKSPEIQCRKDHNQQWSRRGNSERRRIAQPIPGRTTAKIPQLHK